jgi:peptidoglycan/xylan/chitin deacetylase (PgdA/CDA1 family)
MRRRWVRHRLEKYSGVWPVDPDSGQAPPGWPGWPEDREFAFVLTHDVDTTRGQDRCLDLMMLEKAAGFRSSFNFVPQRYQVSALLRQELVDKGFEVGVHGLNHDGRLYSDLETFTHRAQLINGYIREWQAAGFRSPSMQHNLEWIHKLNIDYDASTFDTDPFEPQPDGMGTIFPFMVNGDGTGGYVELPYTMPQDFTLFILMAENGIDIWKRKLEWVAEKGGMVLVNTHPDYMHFGDGQPGAEEYRVELYGRLLELVREKFEGRYWHALPRELASWFRGAVSGDGKEK